MIRRVHRGVYAIGARPSFEQVVAGSCLATGGRASHWTAARLWGFTDAPADPIHLTMAATRGIRPRPELLLHLSRTTEPLVVRSDIPVTSAARTLIDVAGLAETTDAQLLALFGHLLATRAATFERLEARVGAVGTNVRGVARTRRLLDRVGGGIESVAEAELAWLLAEWGFPPSVAQYEVRDLAGKLVVRVDRAWPERGVVLELDGRRFHSGPTEFEADRLRHNALTARGLRVVRATPTMVRERSAQLRADLASALGEPKPETELQPRPGTRAGPRAGPRAGTRAGRRPAAGLAS
jgi:hypothetical protein